MSNESYHTVSSPTVEVCSTIRQLSHDFFNSDIMIPLGIAVVVCVIACAIHSTMVDYTDRVAVAMQSGYEEGYIDHLGGVWVKAR